MANLFCFWNPLHSSQKPKVTSGKTQSTMESWMDHLVCFETFVREGFWNGEHVVSTFFDLVKAYDTR